MAYGFDTAWGNTDNIDRNIAQVEAQIAGLNEGDFSRREALNNQLESLKKQKGRQEWLGSMGQAATLAKNLDPATLAGMLVGNIAGGALYRHMNREKHSDAWNNMNAREQFRNTTNQVLKDNRMEPLPSYTPINPQEALHGVTVSMLDNSGLGTGASAAAAVSPETMKAAQDVGNAAANGLKEMAQNIDPEKLKTLFGSWLGG